MRVRSLRLAAAVLACGGAALGLSACEKHDLSHLTSPDGGFVLTVDYVTSPIGSREAIVSLQEKQGLATTVAHFHNVQKIDVSWLGPSDINVCEVGDVQDYKRTVIINAHDANHLFHVRYGCN